MSKALGALAPFEVVLGSLARVLPLLRVSELPRMSRRAYVLEVAATCLLMIAVAAIDGGVIAVFAKQSFSNGVIPNAQLNLMVGLLGAMGELANVLSFFWSSVSHGRSKVRMLTLMQAVMVCCVAMIALVPTDGRWGLWLLIALVLGARVCWSGMVTLRPTLWRANYPRHVRANVVGVLSGVQVINVAVVGAALAWLLDHEPHAYRVFLPVAGALGMVGVWFTSRLRVRSEARLLREESAETKIMKPWHGPLIMFRVLKQDPWYARFMLWIFVLGFSNLTIMPMLVIALREELSLGYLHSVLITSSIPAAITLLSIPAWRRFLDRAHVVRFRAIHSWVFVVAGVFYTTGAALQSVWLYVLGAVTMGIGFGGGSLAWNLGHVDFARPSETSRYMATHVTLNGVRGLLAPLAVTGVYELLRQAGLDPHLWAQAGSLLIALVGALGFMHLRAQMGRLAEQTGARS